MDIQPGFRRAKMASKQEISSVVAQHNRKRKHHAEDGTPGYTARSCHSDSYGTFGVEADKLLKDLVTSTGPWGRDVFLNWSRKEISVSLNMGNARIFQRFVGCFIRGTRQRFQKTKDFPALDIKGLVMVLSRCKSSTTPPRLNDRFSGSCCVTTQPKPRQHLFEKTYEEFVASGYMQKSVAETLPTCDSATSASRASAARGCSICPASTAPCCVLHSFASCMAQPRIYSTLLIGTPPHTCKYLSLIHI